MSEQILKRDIKCPDCESRNLNLYDHFEAADSHFFEGGVLKSTSIAESSTISYLSIVRFYCNDCGKKFRKNKVYSLNDALEQKPKSKYNWSLIPEHVQFMATDEDGTACGWLVEPKIMGDAWRHQAHLSAYFYINSRNNYLNHFRGDWRESLEQRPEEQSQ